MKALVIVTEDIHDEEKFARYRAKVIASLEPFGGRFLARGGKLTIVEGKWPHQRTVVLEFASREKAEAWYRSPAYQEILPLRLEAARSDFVILDGIE